MQPTHILVINLREIGDILCSTPIFSVLRSQFPDAYITAAITSKAVDILIQNRDIDHVIGIESGKREAGLWQRIMGDFSALGQLVSRPDLAIDLTANDHSTLLAMASRAKKRVGRLRKKGFKGRNLCYHKTIKPNPQIHIVGQFLEILAAIDLQPIPEQYPLQLQTSPQAVADIAPMLELAKKPLIHFSPASRLLKKCWRSERMAALVDHVAERGFTPVLTAAPDPVEQQKVKEVLDLVKTQDHIDLCGKLSVAQLIAVIQQSQCSITVDSAPMHIAAALGKPTLAIFGPTNEELWSPWQTQHQIVTNPLPCRRPCKEKRTCETFECVRDITLLQATEAFDEIMTKPSKNKRAVP